MSEVLLESLSKSFGPKRALKDVNLRVGDGEYLVILGPSGAGKTTLLRTIAGLVDADGGVIRMDGRDVTGLPPDERHVAYMPQVYSLFQQLNVWENTTFSPAVKGWPQRDQDVLAREMLSMVRLIGRRDAFPQELSGGMQQRLALARALAADAEVLLLDEPLRALDARLRIELRNELKGLIRHVGTTTIHVTHDQEEALVVADRIAVLREGELIEVGPSERVYSEPSSPFVANFLGEMNFFEARAFPEDGRVRLVAGGTNLMARAGGTAPASGIVLAGIRAEACGIAPEGWAAGQGLEGTVKRRLFMGRRTSLEVGTPLGLLKVKPLSAQAAWAKEGDAVFVSMPAEHLLRFPMPRGGLAAALEVE